MTRLEFKAKMDDTYSKIEEIEESLRALLRSLESEKDYLGVLADQLEEKGFDDDGYGSEDSKG